MKGKDFKQAKAVEGVVYSWTANLAQGSTALGAALVVAVRAKVVRTTPAVCLTKAMADTDKWGSYASVVKTNPTLSAHIYPPNTDAVEQFQAKSKTKFGEPDALFHVRTSIFAIKTCETELRTEGRSAVR